jgi:hypothetical protein
MTRMNIVEQRYDFMVDVNSLQGLDDVMFERLLCKLYRHRGWLYNYLYGTIDMSVYSPSQQAILRRCAVRFYGREVA